MHRLTRAFFAASLAALVGLPFAAQAETETAIVAGGCFWCVESDFEPVPGVIDVVSGYSGGSSANPTYEDHEGHYEVVQITFDNQKISYAELIAKFLRSVDVTDPGGQFCDRGSAYRTAVFVASDAQRAAAEAAVADAEKVLGQEIATPVLPAKTFWIAEDYHQDYYKGSNIVLTRAGPKKQSKAYKFYREACGRDERVRQVWGNEAFSH